MATTRSARRSVNVLFIGNSFTARNDLPGLIARLAAERNIGMDHRLINRGGASLRMHWNSGAPQKALEGGEKLDFVVLQEQSTLPVKNATRMHENVRLFDPAVRAAGAKTVLYLTWARKHAPESQRAITEAYTSIGKEIGAIIVPAGVAWEAFLRDHDKPVLHDKDGSHPSIAGSYLAACTFLVALFGENPVGIEVKLSGLAPADARLLQETAWKFAR
jgi:hypothetical protein